MAVMLDELFLRVGELLFLFLGLMFMFMICELVKGAYYAITNWFRNRKRRS